jgi:uncharacterized membrane protein YoaK (UPF0700 family)
MADATPIAQPNELTDATLLAGTAGLMDAVVYLNHGHVFANAMTGNVIFLGIAVVGSNWAGIIPRLLPLAGFFLGVLISKHICVTLGARAVPLALSIEILTVLVLGALPIYMHHMLFTGILAFVSALQVATIRRVHSFNYNSTFMTGNIRDVADGLYEALAPFSSSEMRAEGRGRAVDFGFITLAYFVGAIVGGWAAPRLFNHSLWLAEPLLIAVGLRSLRNLH